MVEHDVDTVALATTAPEPEPVVLAMEVVPDTPVEVAIEAQSEPISWPEPVEPVAVAVVLEPVLAPSPDPIEFMTATLEAFDPEPTQFVAAQLEVAPEPLPEPNAVAGTMMVSTADLEKASNLNLDVRLGLLIGNWHRPLLPICICIGGRSGLQDGVVSGPIRRLDHVQSMTLM